MNGDLLLLVTYGDLDLLHPVGEGERESPKVEVYDVWMNST